MAHTRTKKPGSSTEKNAPSRPQTVALKSPIRTPVQSPQKRAMGITEAQKQALMDNLQLEITERARKLRAQYALQAQSLRTRIELRINRIPTSLRKANMGELLEKYVELSQVKQKLAPMEVKVVESTNWSVIPDKQMDAVEENKQIAAPSPQGTKRTSDALDLADKENTHSPAHHIPNPKKRTKGNPATSRQDTNPFTVLSPKSANSRTFQQSPVRPTLGSPQKSYLSRPASPLKQFSPVKAGSPAKAAAAAATASLASMVGEKPKAGRAKGAGARKATNPTTAKGAMTRPKRGAENVQEPEDVRKVSNTSNTSAASTGTTIVNNAKKGPTAAAKDTIGVRAVGKRVAASSDAPPPGRRVLRKRA